jgi:hypothetical protein
LKVEEITAIAILAEKILEILVFLGLVQFHDIGGV